MGANFSCVNCAHDSDSVDNLPEKEKGKRRKAKTTRSSQDQTSQLVSCTIEADVLSVGEKPAHAEVNDEWSEEAFQDLVGDLSEWVADVLNCLSSVSIVDILQPTVCATSDCSVPVLDLASYRANVRRVPIRDVADSSVDVPQVPLSTTSAPGLEMADSCDDVPSVPVYPTSDWEDDVPHLGPTGDTVSENDIIYVGCWSYEVGRKLGEGGFGSVYAGTRLKDGLKVALKFAETAGIKWIYIEENPEPVPMEIGLLILANRGPRVPQIIQLLDWDEEPNRYNMVLEFPSPCESLIDYLDRHDYYIEENIVKVIMHQAVVAAQTCCQRGVLHRDIKLENLLINPDTLDVKLIDFGCGDILTDRGYTSFAGTEEYCPPEYNLFGLYHGKQATVWSLGVLMFTLVCGEFPTAEDLDMLNYNIWTRDGVSQECSNLLCSLLQRHPSKRLKLDVVCLHKWFQYFIYRFYEERSEDLLQKDLPLDWEDDVPPVPVCATSDGEDDGLPDLEDDGLPDLEDDGRPDGEDDGRPDGEDDGLPDWQDDGRPDWQDDGLPDLEDDGRPDWQDDGLPDLEDDGRPDWEDDGRPDWKDDGPPDGEDDGPPDGEDDGPPDSDWEDDGLPDSDGEDDGPPDWKDDGLPDLEDDGRPDWEDDGLPDWEDDGRPDGEDDGLPDLEDDGRPDGEDDGPPDGEDDGRPDWEDDGLPDLEDDGRPDLEDDGPPVPVCHVRLGR